MLSKMSSLRGLSEALRSTAVCGVWALLAFAAVSSSAARAGVGPTVQEVIEFTRIAQPVNHSDDELQTMISPDRKRAFIVTRKSDVAADTNTFEILLLDVDPAHLAAGQVAPPVSLLKVVALRDDYDLIPSLREARWHDNRTLLFRARMQDAPFQVYAFDVPTKRLTQLTSAPDGVMAFDASRDLKRVVYTATVPNPPLKPGAKSIVAGTNSFWNIHYGHLGTDFQVRRYRFYLAEAGSTAPDRPLGDAFPESNVGSCNPSISPDGRWAVLPRYEPGREAAWATQYPLVAEAVLTYSSPQTQDPLSYYTRKTHYVPRRMVFYRLADGHEQSAIDAPDDSIQSLQLRSDRLWQNGGTSIVMAGVFLPVHAADGGPARASHLIEYWPDTGRWTDIAPLAHRLKEAHPVSGKLGTFVAVDGDVRRRFERDLEGGWREVRADDAAEGTADAGADWHLHVQEALNQPPDVVALGLHGEAVRLTELNPSYSAGTWGTMRPYDWTDAKGRPWKGGLMTPADFNPAVRYPLVIQTYAFSPKRFYRDGPNVCDCATSGFAGRAFLREGFLVLVVPRGPTTGKAALADIHGDIMQLADGVKAAVDQLVEAGWVDRDRVGILGWSATGAQVLNLVTFSDAPVRAASILDGDANTLFSMTITYGLGDATQSTKDRANEGLPFGGSLDRWVRNDPSLHTDCIRAALRIESYGPAVRNDWDIYALMRRQYKAVEMVVIPGGNHSLSRPSERMISLQGNVDWYRFWLKDEERGEVSIPGETEASLREQYSSWEAMRRLKREDDTKPRCVAASAAK
ncbi:alpha/beta hydrolase family protein [Burkholderiaceae bacterium UC74_6]